MERPQFILIGEDRININDIVSYGLASDEDEVRYLYVNTSDENDFSYYDEEIDIDDKIAQLDELLLI